MRQLMTNYKVVVTTKNGQFEGVFHRYSEAEEFTATIFECTKEENVTVIISTTEED